MYCMLKVFILLRALLQHNYSDTEFKASPVGEEKHNNHPIIVVTYVTKDKEGQAFSMLLFHSSFSLINLAASLVEALGNVRNKTVF